jgi:hypothetical protein
MSGGGGEVYHGGEFDGGETKLRWSDKEIVGGGSGNGERGKRRKKEMRGGRKGAGELLCPEGCQPRWLPTMSKGTTLGCHHSWRPIAHQGRQPP